MRKNPKTTSEKWPYYIHLPKGVKSPTNSVYKRFEIVSQGRVLNLFGPMLNTVRSAEPFTLRVLMPNGKVKEIASKHGNERAKGRASNAELG